MTSQLSKIKTTGATSLKTCRGTSLFIVTVALLLAMSLLVATPSHADQNIVALVNDEPISAYDIDQRLKLQLIGSSAVPKILRKKLKDPNTPKRFRKFVMAAKPKSKEEVNRLKDKFVQKMRREVIASLRPKFKKEVLEELINERLMLQEAKKLNIVVSDDEVDRQLASMASRSKDPRSGKTLDAKQFVKRLTRLGVSEKAFRTRVKANIALQKVVHRKFGRQINIGAQQVDRLVATANDPELKKETEFQLQRVKLLLPKETDQKTLASRLMEAERLKAKFKSCGQTKQLVSQLPKSTVESLGKRQPKQISQPARAMVQNTEQGGMTPPIVKNGYIELYAVCTKRVILADQKKRKAIQNKLKAEEMARLRRRYVRDLRQDAFVEYR